MNATEIKKLVTGIIDFLIIYIVILKGWLVPEAPLWTYPILVAGVAVLSVSMYDNLFKRTRPL